jgi:hypothetical protein
MCHCGQEEDDETKLKACAACKRIAKFHIEISIKRLVGNELPSCMKRLCFDHLQDEKIAPFVF